jgi:hypothetical protein
MCVSLVGTGIQVIGRIQQLSARNRGADINAEYYRNLADESDDQAKEILNAAEIQQKYLVTSAAKESKQAREKFKSVIGSQTVVFASNGIGGGSVTAQDVALDSLNKSAEDEDLIRYNADTTAMEIYRGSQFQADQLRTRAKHYRTAAKNELETKSSNFLDAIIGGTGDVATGIVNYSRFQKG